jgi:shikimate 5-dehydrogenase
MPQAAGSPAQRRWNCRSIRCRPALKGARARGLRTIDGLGMLMHQAVPAFAAFYGVMPQITPVLRAELEKALRDGD